MRSGLSFTKPCANYAGVERFLRRKAPGGPAECRPAKKPDCFQQVLPYDEKQPAPTMKAILALEDGVHFFGESFGVTGSTTGEACFNTSMTGYQEVLTDPSYRGQILILTYPMVGNYGVPDMQVLDEFGLTKYFESDTIHITGLVVSTLAGCGAAALWLISALLVARVQPEQQGGRWGGCALPAAPLPPALPPADFHVFPGHLR